MGTVHRSQRGSHLLLGLSAPFGTSSSPVSGVHTIVLATSSETRNFKIRQQVAHIFDGPQLTPSRDGLCILGIRVSELLAATSNVSCGSLCSGECLRNSHLLGHWTLSNVLLAPLVARTACHHVEFSSIHACCCLSVTHVNLAFHSALPNTQHCFDS